MHDVGERARRMPAGGGRPEKAASKATPEPREGEGSPLDRLLTDEALWQTASDADPGREAPGEARSSADAGGVEAAERRRSLDALFADDPAETTDPETARADDLDAILAALEEERLIEGPADARTADGGAETDAAAPSSTGEVPDFESWVGGPAAAPPRPDAPEAPKVQDEAAGSQADAAGSEDPTPPDDGGGSETTREDAGRRKA
ncbi:MAG: hypothetical protein AAGI51_14845, partial [Pseudomonadota bacterium]